MLHKEFERAKLLLSNCAYWAMNGLGVMGSLEHRNNIKEICLRNILTVSKQFIIDDPETDTAVRFNGLSATLIPEEGWPEPKRKWMI